MLGRPIAHSLSPVMHRAAYEWLGLDWAYDAYEVDESQLGAFVAGLDASWRGLSLTMPLKRAVLSMLDVASDTVREAQAANTVLLGDGRLVGDNTDVPGILGALAERGVTRVGRAVVLGAGATAESTLVALRRIGLRRLGLRVREPARATELARRAEEAGVDVAVAGLDDPWEEVADLLVSTVPSAAAAAVPDGLLAGGPAVFDVTYDPWPSPLLARAAAYGCVGVTGIDLLAHQAVGQVELMTGRDVPVDVVRAAAVAALESRASLPDGDEGNQ